MLNYDDGGIGGSYCRLSRVKGGRGRRMPSSLGIRRDTYGGETTITAYKETRCRSCRSRRQGIFFEYFLSDLVDNMEGEKRKQEKKIRELRSGNSG